jgi:Flp pilus assembly protein TadG
VLPVFMLVLAGILDFGFLLYSRITLISATRDGARVAIAVTDKTTIPAIAVSAVKGSITGLSPSAVTATVTCVSATASACAFTGSASSVPRLAATGDSVKVVVTYPYHSFFPLFFGQVITIGATVQMVVE